KAAAEMRCFLKRFTDIRYFSVIYWFLLMGTACHGGIHSGQVGHSARAVPEPLNLNGTCVRIKAVENENRSLYEDAVTLPAANLSAQPRKGFKKLNAFEQSGSESCSGGWVIAGDVSNNLIKVLLSFGS
ncbi:MAG TPA: hypothetical protein VGD78_21175, partial [Chthoniobacterales bacterium]